MKTNAKILSPDESPRALATNSSIAFWSDESDLDSRTPKSALIYVVDDMPCLTELYALVLEASGHRVKAFINRHAALAALKAEPEKPALLITDFRNTTMFTASFLQACISAHPDLRIIMATGFGPNHVWSSSISPDRFLQKPFTPEQLQQEVRAALVEELRN